MFFTKIGLSGSMTSAKLAGVIPALTELVGRITSALLAHAPKLQATPLQPTSERRLNSCWMSGALECSLAGIIQTSSEPALCVGP